MTTTTVQLHTPEEMQKIIAQLQAQLAAANAPKALTCKVSAKGALSVYGLGRFPVTLYRSQWERLMAAQGQISAFIKANDTLLAVKAD
jgi:hypothetical protein